MAYNGVYACTMNRVILMVRGRDWVYIVWFRLYNTPASHWIMAMATQGKNQTFFVSRTNQQKVCPRQQSTIEQKQKQPTNKILLRGRKNLFETVKESFSNYPLLFDSLVVVFRQPHCVRSSKQYSTSTRRRARTCRRVSLGSRRLGGKKIINKEKENWLLVKVSFSTKNFSAGVHASLRRVWCGQFVVFILRKLIETKYESGPKVIRVNDDYAMFDGNHLMSLHFCFLFFFLTLSDVLSLHCTLNWIRNK